MIRFPHLDSLDIQEDGRQVLYNSIYDIFMQYKNESIKNIFKYQSVAQPVQQEHPADILSYPKKSPKERQNDIVDQFKSDTIYEYAGFEIFNQDNPLFVNQFIASQSIKQNIIEMIKNSQSLVDKQNYLDAVISIPESNVEVLERFQNNLEKQIQLESFDALVQNVLTVVGGFLQQYCDGKNRLKNGFVIPPIYGIDQDILALYETPQIKDRLKKTITGQRILRVTTDPITLCFVKMCLRVFRNVQTLKKQRTREEYVQRRRMEMQKKK